MKKYDVIWSGLDNGHDGQWHGPIWLPAFYILASHDGANYNDPDSPIYDDLAHQIPSVKWKSSDASSPDGVRLFFRDAREPWSSTGVVYFDDISKRILITDLGKKLVDKSITPREVFIRAMEGHNENGDYPFKILASAFIHKIAFRGITLEQLMSAVMQNFRPGVDDLDISIRDGSGNKFPVTPTRRFRHMLTLLESVGAISSNKEMYVAWDTNILNRLAENKIELSSTKPIVDFGNISFSIFQKYSSQKGYELN